MDRDASAPAPPTPHEIADPALTDLIAGLVLMHLFAPTSEVYSHGVLQNLAAQRQVRPDGLEARILALQLLDTAHFAERHLPKRSAPTVEGLLDDAVLAVTSAKGTLASAGLRT